jgi:hypothetical protein
VGTRGVMGIQRTIPSLVYKELYQGEVVSNLPFYLIVSCAERGGVRLVRSRGGARQELSGVGQ